MKMNNTNNNADLDNFLRRLNDDFDGLIDNAKEWIADGWGLEVEPAPEQIAAALLMEARTQDECVRTGESHPAYPQLLRRLAIDILRYTHSSLPYLE